MRTQKFLRVHSLILIVLFLTCGFASQLQAQDLDPLTGVRVSLASTQALLAVPPLPSLETEGKSTLAVSASYLGAKTNFETTVTTDSGTGSTTTETLSYEGTFTGGALGLGYTSRSFGRLNYFWMIVANHLSGSIDVFISGNQSLGSLKDISTQGYATAGGASYRFIGDSKSTFASGIFLGPSLMYFKNEFKLAQTGNPDTPVYSSEPFIYGAMGGLQVKFRLGNVLIIPYGLYVKELSSSCKDYKSSDNDTSMKCDGTEGKINMPASFAAYGVNLGYKALRFVAYSATSADETMKNIKVTQYQLSYSFGFN